MVHLQNARRKMLASRIVSVFAVSSVLTCTKRSWCWIGGGGAV